jgi:hypothetical protein
MNKLKSITRYTLFTLLALFFLVGCSDFRPTDEKFKVLNMQNWGKKTYKYRMQSIKGRGGFWMVSEQVYKAGDTLTLKPN